MSEECAESKHSQCDGQAGYGWICGCQCHEEDDE
jgi:hypothetical protein